MNKKTLSLLFLLIILVSATISYAYFTQPTPRDSYQTGSDNDIDTDTVSSEIDSTFLEEHQEIEIGEMI